MKLPSIFKKIAEKIKCSCKSKCCSKIVEIDIENSIVDIDVDDMDFLEVKI